jgi:hypothetical protein
MEVQMMQMYMQPFQVGLKDGSADNADVHAAFLGGFEG